MEIEIKDLYDYVQEFYGDVESIPANALKIENEKLLALYKKEDSVYRLGLSNGEVLLPAGNHIVFDKNDKEIKVKDIKIGMILYNNITVTDIEKIKNNDSVYDISVDNDSSTYIKAGTKHHNSSSPRIQNLFRTILNGKLGNTPIPKNVYIIYASNMDNTDGCWAGIEEMDFRIEDANIKKYLQENKNLKKYIKNIEENNIKVSLLGNYTDIKTKTLHKCICETEWMIEPESVLAGVKCTKCKIVNYKRDLKKLGIDVEPLEDYIPGEKSLHLCTCGEEFYQYPSKIKQGVHCGCKKNIPYSKRFNGRKTILYYIKVNDLYKIGITKFKEGITPEDKIFDRYRKDIKKNGIEIEIIGYHIYEDGRYAFLQEQHYLKKFKDKQYNGDKILIAGNTELFESYIKEIENGF